MWELGVITVMGNCGGIRVITVMKLGVVGIGGNYGNGKLGVITVMAVIGGNYGNEFGEWIVGIGGNYSNEFGDYGN